MSAVSKEAPKTAAQNKKWEAGKTYRCILSKSPVTRKGCPTRLTRTLMVLFALKVLTGLKTCATCLCQVLWRLNLAKKKLPESL